MLLRAELLHMQWHRFETRKNFSFNGTVQNQAQGHKCLQFGQRRNVRTLTNCELQIKANFLSSASAKCFTRIQSKVNAEQKKPLNAISKCDKSICLLGFTSSVAWWRLCINVNYCFSSVQIKNNNKVFWTLKVHKKSNSWNKNYWLYKLVTAAYVLRAQWV